MKNRMGFIFKHTHSSLLIAQQALLSSVNANVQSTELMFMHACWMTQLFTDNIPFNMSLLVLKGSLFGAILAIVSGCVCSLLSVYVAHCWGWVLLLSACR